MADQENDLWVLDFSRETLTRLTFAQGQDSSPLWMPDSQSVVFASARGGGPNLYRKAVDGTGDAERLTVSSKSQYPLAVTPDGTHVIFQEVSSDDSWDFAVLDLDGDRREEPLLDTAFRLFDADLSPDGKWLAYQTDTSGTQELYVRPFPNVDAGRWQISGDAVHPLWGPGGGELFFETGAGQVMRVAIETEPEFRPGNAVIFFGAGTYAHNPFDRSFDISPDGQRFF